MSIFDWMNPMRWLMLLALCGSLTLGYFSWRSHERDVGAAPYIAAINKQKIEAAVILKIETDKASATTNALKDFSIQQGKDDAINTQTISILADKLHGLTVAGRLRDPAGCGSGTAQSSGVSGAGGGAENGANASGLLSESLSGLLSSQAKIADSVNVAYISCRADERKLRAEWPK